jgi:hypothetical protein
MTFVSFGFLIGGGILIAVPVILHMLMRGKPRTIEFPALQFVQSRRLMNQRRFRLKHLLLLALRMLLILLFAALLARPSLKSASRRTSQEAPVAAAIVVDTAPRMELTQSNQSRLELASETGQWVLTQLPKQSRVAIVDGRRTPPVFQVDVRAADQQLERLRTNYSARSVSQSIDRALELLDSAEEERRELYVFTDMSDSAWTSDAAESIRRRAEQMFDLSIHVIDVGAESTPNMAIRRIRLSEQVIAGRAPLTIEVDLEHFGPPTTRGLVLYLESPTENSALGGTSLPTEDEEGRRQAGFREVSFDEETTNEGASAGSTTSIAFELSGLNPGLYHGELELSGQDALTPDDQYHFTFLIRPARPVLVVAPAPADEYATAVREALSPASFRRLDLAPYRCDVIASDELSDYLENDRLREYEAVMLLDPAQMSTETWTRLYGWTAQGGGLGVFLGRNASAIDSFNAPEPQRLLPGTIVRQARAPDGDLFLAPSDYENTILNSFRTISTPIPWQVVPIYRYWQLGRIQSGVSVDVPLSDGSPLILTRTVGAGRTLLMTSPVSDAPNDSRPWNLLPYGETGWTFLILADGMARYLTGAQQQNLNYFVGQTAVLGLPDEPTQRTYILTKPDGGDVSLSADQERRALRMSSTDQPGSYRIRSGGAFNASAQGADLFQQEFGFSVNPAPAQLDLRRTVPSRFDEIFGETPYRLAGNREEIEREVARGRVGRELFSFLAILIVLLLAGELILSNMFFRRKGGESNRPDAKRSSILDRMTQTAKDFLPSPTGEGRSEGR